ncbi:hypothetical protein DSUL_20065 [Desulfovibrionales bacterium]
MQNIDSLVTIGRSALDKNEGSQTQLSQAETHFFNKQLQAGSTYISGEQHIKRTYHRQTSNNHSLVSRKQFRQATLNTTTTAEKIKIKRDAWLTNENSATESPQLSAMCST